jgi:uncharacterized protein
MSLEARLIDAVRGDADLMRVLQTAARLDLNDWLIFSGSVYQCVWNAITGRPAGHGIKDFDLGYFDEDVSWDAEDAVIRRVAAAFDQPLRGRVEVRNQRRVSEWFPQKFGEPYPPVASTAAALDRFVAPAFAVGVRMTPAGEVEVEAPFGLDDVFSLTVRPNPNRPKARDWDRVVAGLRARWPEITVIEETA